MNWWEDLLLAVVGTPVLFLAMLIWGCAIVALWDAVSAFRKSDHIRKLMARRWPDED